MTIIAFSHIKVTIGSTKPTRTISNANSLPNKSDALLTEDFILHQVVPKSLLGIMSTTTIGKMERLNIRRKSGDRQGNNKTEFSYYALSKPHNKLLKN
ncbi:MAG: hypothetical protein J6P15_08310 [Fibrobacter sp.]|nr:hypothetical protein [Fibrobacter sp.]